MNCKHRAFYSIVSGVLPSPSGKTPLRRPLENRKALLLKLWLHRGAKRSRFQKAFHCIQRPIKEKLSFTPCPTCRFFPLGWASYYLLHYVFGMLQKAIFHHTYKIIPGKDIILIDMLTINQCAQKYVIKYWISVTSYFSLTCQSGKIFTLRHCFFPCQEASSFISFYVSTFKDFYHSLSPLRPGCGMEPKAVEQPVEVVIFRGCLGVTKMYISDSELLHLHTCSCSNFLRIANSGEIVCILWLVCLGPITCCVLRVTGVVPPQLMYARMPFLSRKRLNPHIYCFTEVLHGLCAPSFINNSDVLLAWYTLHCFFCMCDRLHDFSPLPQPFEISRIFLPAKTQLSRKLRTIFHQLALWLVTRLAWVC